VKNIQSAESEKRLAKETNDNIKKVIKRPTEFVKREIEIQFLLKNLREGIIGPNSGLYHELFCLSYERSL